MAKIGTAHVEIKPVLNDEALNLVCERVSQAVKDAVLRGYAEGGLGHDLSADLDGGAQFNAARLPLLSPPPEA